MNRRIWWRNALTVSGFLLFTLVMIAIVGTARGDTLHSETTQPIRLVYASFDPLLEGEPQIVPGLSDTGSPYNLLQLTGPPEARALAELQALGVVFYEYVPVYTYVVTLEGAGREAVTSHPAVRWLGPLHPAYKISPTATGGRLVLSLFPGAPANSLVTTITLAGASVVEVNEAADLLVVEAEEALLPALAALEGVRWIQNAVPLQEFNDDARWVSQGGMLETTPLYERGLSGAGQVGAVADSGLAVYPYAPADDPLYNPVPSCFVVDDAGGAPRLPGADHRKVLAYEIPPGAQGDTYDSSGHGTHVVSSVVGDRPPWNEASPADGQAYEARVFFQDIGVGVGFPQNPIVSVNPPSDYRVMFAQAYDPDGDGAYDPASEARTHSNSWGSTDPIYSVESAQTDAFIWEHPDFLILFAAGNQGPAPATIGYPATAKNVVTVGATENGMADPDSMAYFSSHGAPGRALKPTVSAPGDRVTSALQGDPCGTTEKSGTSMATPTVHGIALLMRQYLWDGYYPSGAPNAADRLHPSAALLKALLISSGRPIDGAHTDNGAGGAWPSRGQGWGRVTADDALYFQGDHRSLWLHDEVTVDGSAGFAAAGETRTFTLAVGDGQPFAPEPLKITLSWSDYPATPLSGGLVNDLNLIVTDPLGNAHLGNDPATNDFRGAGELPLLPPDSVNPWEVVYLEEPIPGEYTITVRAASLGSLPLDPQRKQGFALAATGDLLGTGPRAELEYPVYDASPSATARIRVVDLEANSDPLRAETVSASAGKQGTDEAVRVRLVETEAGSGIFSGALVLTTETAIPGALQVAPDDVVELLYEDGKAAQARDWARIGQLPLNFSDPARLETVDNSDGDGRYRLQWSEVPGAAAYQVQETTFYTAPLADDAEGDANALWTTGQADAAWRSDVQYRRSGERAYWSGRGDTGFSIDTALTLREPITLPATATSAQLGFYSRYYNDFNDNGFVELSGDGAQSWTPVRRLYADPRVVPAHGRLRYHQFDLSSWIGQPLLLRFRYDNGVASVAPDSPGWWLDDIIISGGDWQTVVEPGVETTSLAVAGRAPRRYHYRVRALFADGNAGGWSAVQAVDVTTSTPAPGAAGGGWLEALDGSKLSFNFHVEENSSGATGQVQFKDREAGVRLRLNNVEALNAVTADCGPVSGVTTLAIRGSGQFNGAAASFVVCVEDNGEPGAGQDRFFLACRAGCGYRSDERTVDATIDGGNIQMHSATDEPQNENSDEARVVILEPLLEDGAPAGDLFSLFVQVYDANLAAVATAPIVITATAGDGTSVRLEAVTDMSGSVEVPVVVGDGPVEYVATVDGIASNPLVLAPEPLPVVSP